jgi:hypothetical protein
MCCGRTTQPVRQVTPTSLGDQSASGGAPSRPNIVVAPQFEYTGKTALTVVSPVSGKHYRFAQPGARLEADIRDRSWLAFVPQLKRAN